MNELLNLVERSRGEVSGPVSRSPFTEDVSVGEEVALQRREGAGWRPLADGVEVVGDGAERDAGVVENSAVGVDVVEEVLVVDVLLVPFDLVVETEVVADEDHHHVVRRQRPRLRVLSISIIQIYSNSLFKNLKFKIIHSLAFILIHFR